VTVSASSKASLTPVTTPETARHFRVGLDQAAHIVAEAVLVHFLSGLQLPQPAAVGTDLVSQDNLGRVAGQATEFEFEVDKTQSGIREKAA
jgi:hypothetical protein